MLEALLSTLKGTELWHSVSSVIPVFEKIIGSMVNSTQAENGENAAEQQEAESLATGKIAPCVQYMQSIKHRCSL